MAESGLARRPTPEELIALALATGVELDGERAAALVFQAEPHFELLRALARVDPKGAEPAGEFRLDGARGAGDG